MPSIVKLPLVGRSNVPKICKSVVFPAPEDPTIDTIYPFSIERLTSFNIVKSPYLWWIEVARSIISLSF